jgi:hypothetical protein
MPEIPVEKGGGNSRMQGGEGRTHHCQDMQ